MSDSVELKGVEETLTIPLWARAIATRRGGLIDDPAAVELVERLGYDFESKLGHAKTMMPMLEVRAARFDQAVREFVERHPDGAVVELGCGLDTRWERCGGGRVDWFDLDLPAVIGLRRRYFEDGARRRMLAASLQDTAWHDRVGPRERPFLFVAEAVLYYLEPDDVARFIRAVSTGFPASSIVFDTVGTGVMSRQAGHPMMRHYDARFRWAVDDLESLVADTAYTVASAEFLAELRRDERKRLPLVTRLFYLVFTRMSWFRESSRLVRLSSLDS